MSRPVFNIIVEPRCDVLRTLLRAIQGMTAAALVVIRDDLGLTENGKLLVKQLEPHLIERRRSSSWPGTILLDEEATILRFAMNQQVIDILLAASDGLYDWQQPQLPEDLCFLRKDGSSLLTTISHEHDCFLEIDDAEYNQLTEAFPRATEILRRQE